MSLLPSPRSLRSLHRSFSTSPAPRRPLKLAIIGAGPSGFYAASRILASLPIGSAEGKDVEVHMYDRLPTPYGLVRYGVAPDHPEVKNCQHKFDELSSDPRFRFLGNISIGPPPPPPSPTSPYTYPHALHIPLSSLFPHYTTLLLTYGSSLSSPLPTTSRSSSSPDPLDNVFPALAFVSWYNGHPAYAHLAPDLSVEDATIIGHGNVAIDCARILLKDPASLATTDLPSSVLEVLQQSKIRRVEAVGRRGPAQVAFTTKEFREMMNLPGVGFEPIEEGLMREAKAVVEGEGERARKRLLGLMETGGKGKVVEGGKVFKLGFLKSPKAFEEDPSRPGKVGSVEWSINSLLSPPSPPPSPLPAPPTAPPISSGTTASSSAVARPTGEVVRTKAGLVIESVGYRSETLTGGGEGWELPFDTGRGRVGNDGGRVVGADGVMIPGIYAAGWVARGPVGVIASTSLHAYSVASLILSDHFSASDTSSSLASPLAAHPAPGIPEAVKNSTKRVVELKDWHRIDAVERERGREKGKEREKILSVEGMLEVLD